MAKTYNLTNIRALLTQGFGPDDLRRLCYDTPDFRPVYHELALNTGKAEIVSKLMEYAEQNLKLDQLLALLQARNPGRYGHHQPYYAESSPAPAPPAASSTTPSPVSNVQQPAPETVPVREKAGPAYVTYHVEVTPDGQAVHVTVTQPDGRGGGNPRGPFCLAEVRADILALVEQVGQEPPTATRRELERLGELLFGALFCDSGLAEHFRSTYRQARERNQGLRLELDFDETRTPEIAALPWEFIRAPQTAGYPAITLATDPNLVLSRRRSLWEPPSQISQSGPWSILVAVAAPDDPELGPVVYEEVVTELRALVDSSPGFAPLGEPLLDTDAMKLDEALGAEPDILHFIGHGRFVLDADDPHGELAMVGAGGWTDWLRDDDVGSLLERHVPAVVFLQACQGGTLNSARGLTGVASKIVQRNAPVVVAMQYPLTNAAALLFARKFYERLAAGDPVDKAAQEGRRALWFKFIGQREFATPVLFMRAPDGRLFADQGSSVQRTGAAPRTSGDVITATGGSTVINRSPGAAVGSAMVDTTGEPAQIPGKRVWFDQSHQQEKWDWGPIPTIEEFGYRAAKKYAEQAGYVVKALDRSITGPDTLADCDLLIMLAPYHLHLQPAEIKFITRFVQNGKSLLLLSYYAGDSHHQNNLSELGKEFGVEFKSDRIVDAVYHRHNRYEILIEGASQDEELLQGVDRLCFRLTCSLQVSEPARVVLRSSPDSFTEKADVADTGQILSWTPTTNSQTPLVAVAAYGAGRFAAVGTWTVFLSDYLESAELGNRQFYLNLLHWLTASIPSRSVPVAEATRTTSGRRLDYERGLKRLRALLDQQASAFLADFLTLEARLQNNLKDEQLYGSTETIRADRARIIRSLNDLARQAGLSETFNDLAME